VHQYLKPGNPLGQSVQMKGFRMGGVRNLRIVGVVKDAVYETLRAAAPATIYAPYVHRSPGTVTLLVHAPGSTTAVTSAIKSELQPKLNGRLLRVQTMTAQLESSIARERLLATIATLFGALALALAAIGLYGLLSYWVSRRTHEIGVRMALGADRATVVAFVIKDAMWLLAIGCALGGVTAWGLARFVKGLVFGVPANDPATIAGSILVLTAAGIIAAWLPARRATLIDPITALRVE
jgi:ABC-type antimicrobial peptide transport system permease subunit